MNSMWSRGDIIAYVCGQLSIFQVESTWNRWSKVKYMVHVAKYCAAQEAKYALSEGGLGRRYCGC